MSSIARIALLCLLVFGLATTAAALDGVETGAVTAAKPDLKSAGQLAFGPDNVLFVADSTGTAVWALDLQDGEKPAEEPLPRVEAIDEKIAALLGTSAGDVLINDLAVHPASKSVYLSASRGRGDGASPVLVRVAGDGELSLVDLAGKPFSKAMIENAPSPEAKSRRGRPLRALTITDIAFSDGHLYVAGLSNEEFASNLRKLSYPFNGTMEATSVEIFHGAHGQYETHAPIRTLVPYEIEGKEHLLAAYTCTPLVTFPLDELENGKHVKGTTIAELGFGNSPLDMIRFDKDGKPYILVLNSSRGGMKIAPEEIQKASAISDKDEITREEPTSGVPYVTVPMGGVLRADNFDDNNLVVLRRDLATGSLQLRLWRTEWI